MQYLILAAESEEDFAQRTNKAAFEAYMEPWMVYSRKLQEAGVMHGGKALEGPHTATTVRLRNGSREVHDGPFADAKEQLGGYFIVNCESLDEAKKWASECPAAKTGHVEVRKIMQMG